MYIVIAMFARGGGGVEQSFVDYCEGLRNLGHRVTAIVYPDAVVHKQLMDLSIHTLTLRNIGEWDILASYRLRTIIERLAPQLVIGYSNRAFSLTRRAIKGRFPLVGVAQNYSTRRLSEADAVFTTTQDLIRHLIKQGIPEDNVFHIPNMVHCKELPHRAERNDPPVIGTMGRFVAKKGFDVYIEALRQLKERGYRFRAELGGTGVEGAKLKKQASEAGLDETLSFLGWVQDKKSFYQGIDIFCLPSLHEPFGIVLLEAFTHGTPVVATDSEGPIDIITPNFDALMVKKGDAKEMADAIAKLLDDPAYAQELAANAFAKTKTRYALDVVAGQIAKALEQIFEKWRGSSTESKAA